MGNVGGIFGFYCKWSEKYGVLFRGSYLENVWRMGLKRWFDSRCVFKCFKKNEMWWLCISVEVMG